MDDDDINTKYRQHIVQGCINQTRNVLVYCVQCNTDAIQTAPSLFQQGQEIQANPRQREKEV